MNIDNLTKRIENIFLELGFEYKTIGKKRARYLIYNNCYCKITYLETIEAFVIESTDNIRDAAYGVLEDGDLYYIDGSEEDMLYKFKKDIIAYYMT